MKKLLSIVLAFCMLFTMVSAANTITQDGDAVLNTSERTVTVKFVGIPETEQATLLAYEVTAEMIAKAKADAEAADEDPETAVPAYVDEETTPIKGIDQATVSTITTTVEEVRVSSFTFKVAADYVGKMVVKVGGTDADPIAMIVEFVAAGGGEDPDPDQPGTGGGEGGEDPDPDQPGTGGGEGGETPDPDPVVPDVILSGDVDGNTVVDANDAWIVEVYAMKKGAAKGRWNTANGANCGDSRVLADNSGSVIVGDVDGNTVVDANDAWIIEVYAMKKGAAKGRWNTANGADCGDSLEVLPVVTE